MNRSYAILCIGLVTALAALGGIAADHPSQVGTDFWAVQPLRDSAPPAVTDSTWLKTPVDRYILARLEAAGLSPAEAADKRTLLRRATFDLIGLPPTEDQINRFLADDSPQAFEKVIEELLASPAYGQRWARHWLDLVRYTDSKDSRGMGSVGDVTPIWRYRDWVVDAFNRDYPYDQFIVDQVAGDILSAQSPTGLDEPRLIATGMLALGEWGAGDSDKRKMMTDIVDDQIDVVGRSILGITIACARCHDHKFDPISARDYYALAGFFFSSHIVPEPGDPTQGTPMLYIPLLTTAQKAERLQAQEQLNAATREIEALLTAQRQALAKELKDQVASYLQAVAKYSQAMKDATLAPQSLVHRTAEEMQLNPLLMQRWVAYLGLPDGREPHTEGLFNERFTNLFGTGGVWGWRKSGNDLPLLTAYPGEAPQTILTFTLPAQSVSVHPSPKQAVVVAWRSPLQGRVRVTGRVADADAAGGNGVTWSLHKSRHGVQSRLAGAVMANGQAQDLPIKELDAVEVREGDFLNLVIEPTGTDHVCDTTVVELRVETEGRAWSLTSDVLRDSEAAHPLADSYGHQGVWYFYSQDNGRAPPATPAPGSAMGRWLAAWQQQLPVDQLELLATEVSQSIAGNSPQDGVLHHDLTAADGFFLKSLNIAATLPAESQARLSDLNNRAVGLRNKLAEPFVQVVGIQEGGVPKSEHEEIRDARMHVRGDYHRQTDPIPRGFPAIFGSGSPQIPENSSGRLALARWLVDTRDGAGPLAARVAVNYIWQHHFGRGLVATPDNFGKLGEAPSHPQLLDHLAARFIESGWSVKAMHRLIMNSAVYQQSTVGREQTIATDPDNLLLGRMNRRRLDVESLRDSLLAVSGRLDPSLGGMAVQDIQSPRRTIYINAVRSNRSTFRELFDGADTTAIIAKRVESTVAPQSLFMLNNPFVLAQTQTLAERILKESLPNDESRIARLYEWVYARPPTDDEIRIGVTLLKNGDWAEYCQVLLCANEFIYVD